MVEVNAADQAIALHKTTFFRLANGRLEPVLPRTCQRFVEFELSVDDAANELVREQALVEYLGTGIRWDDATGQYTQVHLVTHDGLDEPRPASGYINILQR